MRKLLVFTDLDGTLLDHHNYSWDAAIPALDELNQRSYPLIINSSKTKAEIIRLRKGIDNNHPFICENGAVIYIPKGYFGITDPVTDDDSEFIANNFGISSSEIISKLDEIRQQYRFKFTGFHDMTALEIGKLCGLDEEQSINARQREATEPIIWNDTEESLEQFKSMLSENDLIVVKGGRFYHVMAEVDKGESLIWLKKQYEANETGTDWVTIGLGDSFNDVRMLEVVDYPVLVLFDSERPEITIGQIISSMGLSQFHCAETEKYAHVTYFFNGGRSEAYSGEARLLIPSPGVATYDLKPQMSAHEVADAVIKAISLGRHSFIVVNFANGDMVGHTAKRHAVLSAVKTLDTEVGRLLDAAESAGYSVLLTADHGNCEEMIDPQTGDPHTRHTNYPVPCLVIDKSHWELSTSGGLSNIAPTILELMGIRKPETMNSGSLLLKEHERVQKEPDAVHIRGVA